MTETAREELMETLAELAGPTPDAARAARVRARCHSAMHAAAVRPRGSFAAAASRALDHLLPVAVVIYAIVTVAEFFRIG